MHISLSLVGLTLLALQCRSQPVENDRQYPAVATQYQQIDQENLRQERQLQQLSRQDRRIPQDYRYQYDSEQSYPAETQYQPSYSGPSNNRLIGRPQQLKQPAVEQYLKEVTPTTKTTYVPRTYQAEGSNKAQTAEEYFLRPEAQKRPYIQHPQYELAESPKETAVPQNVLAYQNAIIAQQNAIYEQQRADQLQKQQDSAHKSSFYAPQSIQKKPTTVEKLVKPKPSSLDEELEYLTRLQYQQQQIQQQSKAYENKQPLVAKYQARIPQYSKPELLAAEEEQAQTYQPQVQYTLTRFAKPSKAPKLQIYQPEYKTSAQPEPSNFDQFDHTQYEQPQLIQYQPTPQHQELTQPQQYSAGPKYLPEQKLVRYQQPVEEKYTQQVELPRDEALQKYRASIAKYHATDSSKTEPRPQIRPQYIQHEQPQKFQAQQYEQPAAHQQPQQQKPSQEIYQGPTDEEYRQSEFKQSLGLNSSLRVLKSGKPVVFIGHEE